eukprot:TRINITY_DN8581_c0_g1_i5.p1 TRINITY_DN8581_c0_g1~~TRINITY_DN8581_c0_g1_i5.p1  ORF type:complete len:151 (+),score=22.56 TRINITY_DN8581_c0_g1_i5:547-999(+)
MMLKEIVDPGLITEKLFLYGFALIQVMPGPLFNLAAFLGGVIEGIGGAIVAWACLFAPGVLLILGVYPFWTWLSKFKAMKRFLVGVNAAALGLIVTAFFILFGNVRGIFIACAIYGFCMSFFFGLMIPLSVLTAGVLGLLINVIDKRLDF